MSPRDRGIDKIHCHSSIRPSIGHPVHTCTPIQPVGARASLQNVVTATTPYPVISVIPFQIIRNRVAGNQIVPGTGNEILNYRIPRNNQVACQAVYIRDTFRAQVNLLILCVRTQVKRVVAAVIIDRKCRRVGKALW